MISITELWCGKQDRNHKLRYEKPRNIENIRPVVVWNCTRRCNLKCIHCYSNSENKDYAGELTTDEAKKMIDDLAEFKIPCLLFSGGEPFTRPDIFELIKHANTLGLPVAISTNGTLIDDKTALKLKDSDIRYVGISLDGLYGTNDRFRGVRGAFLAAKNAFSLLQNNLINCGLRFTLTKYNLKNLSQIFEFVGEHNISRVCFYHLVPTGRGESIKELTPTAEETREAIDRIISWSEKILSQGFDTEVLTVDNHADNIYLYLKKQSTDILNLIKQNGGAKFSSGVGISCIDELGNIHPDQFLRDITFGNVRNEMFSHIWTNPKNEIHKGLKDRLKLIKGRCSTCKWLELCGGGLRSRAYALTSDPWEADPDCYLTDEEIK